MTANPGLEPVAAIEEMIRAMTRGFRAFQMYLPNNPMYERAAEGLDQAMAPVFEVLDDLTLMVDETRLVWEGEVVYDQPSKSESFAWGLYKDGMRVLAFRRGVETEMARFLQTVSRARLLAADASDDLLTLLWEQSFEHIRYHFAEVVQDPWVYDPQALSLGPREGDPAALLLQVQEEVREPERPKGMIALEDFDSTLYFLDETEIAALNRQVADEYGRNIEAPALDVLFDVFELVGEPEVRAEILEVLDRLLPHLLSQGAFQPVAHLLREMRAVRERLKLLDPGSVQALEQLEHRLSEPEILAQLLQALDEAEAPPAEEDLGAVLRELLPGALGTILSFLPRLGSPTVREMVQGAAERLATAHPRTLVDLLGQLTPDALPGAIRLAARLQVQPAVPGLGNLVRSGGVDVRLAAAEALGRLGTPGALAALEPALDDPDRTVRAVALGVVSERSYMGAVRRLEAAVLGKGPVDLERAERRLVFETYAQIAGPSALDLLRDLIEPQGLFKRKASVDIRTCAVYAVGRIRTPDARALLDRVSQDKDLPVRHAATTLLREWPA